ncbi:MAG TPA: hypothetical protein VJ964_14885 [Balneolaceae bacterium]|nr:hypothetical protein [Balneolaceae bacterium]
MKYFKKILPALLFGLISLSITNNAYAQKTQVGALIKQAKKAGIEQQALTDLQNRAKERGVSDQQLQAIIKTAISMSEENLPSNVVIQKSLEGFSKGIPANRIISVVRQEHQSMKQAAGIIDPWIQKSSVQQMLKHSNSQMSKQIFRNELAKATSKSIMRNMSSETINGVLSQIGNESVLSHAQPSDVVAAMGILPDLSSSANSKTSGNFVVRALKGGFNSDDLQKLPSAMRMAQQRGELPAASVLEGVLNQMKKGVPARQIIQNLINGKIGGGPPGNKPPGLGHKGNHGHSNGSNGNGS